MIDSQTARKLIESDPRFAMKKLGNSRFLGLKNISLDDREKLQNQLCTWVSKVNLLKFSDYDEFFYFKGSSLTPLSLGREMIGYCSSEMCDSLSDNLGHPVFTTDNIMTEALYFRMNDLSLSITRSDIVSTLKEIEASFNKVEIELHEDFNWRLRFSPKQFRTDFEFLLPPVAERIIN